MKPISKRESHGQNQNSTVNTKGFSKKGGSSMGSALIPLSNIFSLDNEGLIMGDKRFWVIKQEFPIGKSIDPGLENKVFAKLFRIKARLMIDNYLAFYKLQNSDVEGFLTFYEDSIKIAEDLSHITVNLMVDRNSRTDEEIASCVGGVIDEIREMYKVAILNRRAVNSDCWCDWCE